MSIQFFWLEFEDFFAFRDAFLGMQPVNQILAFIALVAITVGVILLVYYIVKEAFILVFKIFKWMARSLKSFFKSIHEDMKHSSHHVRKPRHVKPRRIPLPPQAPMPPRAPMPPMPPMPPKAPLPPQAPLPPEPPKTTIYSEPQSELLHCPMCGEKFTGDMMNLLERSQSVFCEFCGKQLEYVLN